MQHTTGNDFSQQAMGSANRIDADATKSEMRVFGGCSVLAGEEASYSTGCTTGVTDSDTESPLPAPTEKQLLESTGLGELEGPILLVEEHGRTRRSRFCVRDLSLWCSYYLKKGKLIMSCRIYRSSIE